jgi:hypothetical protein
MAKSPEDTRQQALVFVAIFALVGAIVVAGVGAIIYSRIRIDELPDELAGEDPRNPVDAQPVAKLERPPPPEEGYVGSLACNRCHAEIGERYQTHPMAHSLAQVHVASPLEDYEHASFSPPGPRRYYVEKKDGKTLHHEVMEDKDGEVIYDQGVEVKFALGSGRRGRSYLIFDEGTMYQSPIGWYAKDKNWDLSPGYTPDGDTRFMRRITEGCLYCHSGRTNLEPGKDDHYAPAPFLEAAIGCERCHGPGKKHIAFHEAGGGSLDPIVNPAKLEHELSESVCYQCHLQGEHTLLRYGRQHRDFRPGQRIEDNWIIFVKGQRVDEAGETKAVSQVEQMRASRCYIESNRVAEGGRGMAEGGRGIAQGGRGMGCTSCHDPHWSPPPEERTRFYLDRCNQCHAEQGCAVPEPERLASNAAGSCIACHMPPLSTHDVPHTALTDHRILRKPAQAAAPEAEGSTNLELASVFDNADERLPKRVVDRAKGLVMVRQPEVIRNSQLLTLAQNLIAPVTEQMAARNHLAFLDVIGDDVDALIGLGNSFQIQRDYERAHACWQQLLQISPHDEIALWWMLANNHQRGNLQQAAAYLDRLIALLPTDPKLHGRRAHILGQMGRLSEGIEAAERALELDPTLIQVREWLVEAYTATDQPAKAGAQRQLIKRMREVMEVPDSAP